MRRFREKGMQGCLRYGFEDNKGGKMPQRTSTKRRPARQAGCLRYDEAGKDACLTTLQSCKVGSMSREEKEGMPRPTFFSRGNRLRSILKCAGQLRLSHHTAANEKQTQEMVTMKPPDFSSRWRST